MTDAPTAPAGSSAAPSERAMPRGWLLLVCLLLLVAAIYFPCIGGPYVWDDYHLILDSPDVTSLKPALYYFQHKFWNDPALGAGASNYYRPLTTWSLALDHSLHGDNSGGFHLTNLALHLTNTSLLFGILRRRGAAAWTAALATGLWALFPRLTEAAAWISGRTDLLAGLFVLLAFYCASREGSLLFRALSALCLLLGLLSKEVALAAALALMLDVWLEQREKPLRARVLALCPYAVMLALYGALRFQGAGLTLADSGVLRLPARCLAFVEAAGRYVWMTVDAFQPDAQIGALSPRSWPFFGLGVCALLAAAWGSLWVARHGERRLQVALVWGGLSLFLAMHLLPTPIDVVAADRFMYLPLAALVVGATPAFERWLRGRPYRALAPVLLLASYSVASYVRVGDWSDEVRFWLRFYHQHREHNTRAAVELGNVFFRGHFYADALRIFLSADDPGSGSWALVARANAAACLTALGREQEAHHVASDVTAAAPSVPSYAMTAALTDLNVLDFDAAERHLKRALELYPGYPQAQSVLAKLPGIVALSKTLPAEPHSTLERLVRARFYAQVGRRRDALHEWQIAAESGEMHPLDWVEALYYVLELGDAKSARWFVEHGRPAMGPAFDPRMDLAYEHRLQTEARLREAWRELGLGLAR